MILRGLAIWSSVGIGHLAVLGSIWSVSPAPENGASPLLLDLHLVAPAAPRSPLPPPAVDQPAARRPAEGLAIAPVPRPISPPAARPLSAAITPLHPVGDVSDVRGVVATPPRFLARVEPAYPPRARRAGAEGVVTIRLRLSAAGRVLEAEVAAGSGEPLLDQAALAAALASRYEPATQGGQPVVSETTADYRFELR